MLNLLMTSDYFSILKISQSLLTNILQIITGRFVFGISKSLHYIYIYRIDEIT